MGCAKIETLFGKVRKSREKIDQVLTDLYQYQKEFETIVINKKCRPAKLKISRKIMETRLDCYKNYLLHLQSIIDDLEREIRQFKMREKEYDKQAKIAGVGVAQKHNTYADQLQKKIKMLEDLIEKKKKMGSSPKRSSQSKNRTLSKKRGSKPIVRTQNVAGELKNAKNDLKDRNDQINLLTDMLNSSIHENKMKEREIDRLQKKLKSVQGGSGNPFNSMAKIKPSEKQNRTENTFLPESLRGAVRAEASFPHSSKSGKGGITNERGFPSVKGAYSPYDDRFSREYDNGSQKSQSQVSLAISQKRGEKIVQESRKKMEQYAEPKRKLKETKVTKVEQIPGEEDLVNLRIQEEDPNLEEGTLKFNKMPYEDSSQMMPDIVDEDSGFEEGQPNDYDLNED